MDPTPIPNTSNRHHLEEQLFECAISLFESWRAYLVDNGSTDGLSMMHVSALLAIKRHQPIPSRRLGQLLRITPGAVTQLIDIMASDGMVKRQDNPEDRRVSELVLMPEGDTRLDEIMNRRRATFVSIYQALSDDEIRVLNDLFEKLSASLAESKKQLKRKDG